jgi:arsenate reductase
MQLHPELNTYVDALQQEYKLIPEKRKSQLQALARYIADKKDQSVALNFICTHNSRRSHLAQIWSATAATYFGKENIQNFSGGTEATAFHINAINALERAGFQISKAEGENPVYEVSFSEEASPMECFSKVFHHPVNPTSGFAAILTCSDADENCPFVPGAEWRLPLTYEDPKQADGTPQEAARYDERVKQIGREIFYAFNQLNKS